ncbi:MAG: hypothetical protein JSS87_15150 [Acidobacteria bacterium]|nr:hypothetical protein [Acidobacteriota bacterium]
MAQTQAPKEVEQKVEAVQKMESKSAEPVLSMNDLLAILGKMSDAQTDRLANALIEAKKPYIDPKDVENAEIMRAQAREQYKREKEGIKRMQDNCPHIRGCNPLSEMSDPSGLTSIAWHKLDSGEVIGICTYCTRVFKSADPDYQLWRNKKSGNRLSAAGDREFTDRAAARAAVWA